MIRINLLAVREHRKKREGRQVLLLFILLLTAEVLGVNHYATQINTERTKVNTEVRELNSEVAVHRTAESKYKELDAEIQGLEAQAGVFENLKDQRSGPANLLLYMAYVLTPRKLGSEQLTLTSPKELSDLERIGWNINWDSNTVWLHSLDIGDGEMNCKGAAMSHEDVAEFSKRLESGVFFPGVEPEAQSQKYDRDLGFTTVLYELRSKVNFRIPKTVASADTNQE